MSLPCLKKKWYLRLSVFIFITVISTISSAHAAITTLDNDIIGDSAVTIRAGGINQNITIVPSGTGYTILQGNVGIGDGTPASLLTVGNNDAFQVNKFGGISASIADTSNVPGLTIIQKDATNNPKAAEIINYGSNNALKITQNASTPNSTSVGGALNVINTNNSGPGLVVYSNQGAAANGHLVSVRVDNPQFDQSSFYVSYNGTSHAVNIVNRGNGGANAAANITSNNSSYSAVSITGQELTHGTVKISHVGSGNDANAAAVSLDLQGVGTAAQGIYINSTSGGTTGRLIHVLNNNVPMFAVMSDGRTGILTNSPASALSVGIPLDPNTSYAQIDVQAGTPPVNDCNSNSEAGRLLVDASGVTGQHKLYICTGATDGWDSLLLAD